MDEIRHQAIKADVQDLIHEYLSDEVGDDELKGFITRAEADEEPVTLVNEIVDEMDYRKAYRRRFDRIMTEHWEEMSEYRRRQKKRAVTRP
jgi:mannitol-1-phosphate/altronate dehydrogenase